jgi:chemotaxis protein methyltransferase CheR
VIEARPIAPAVAEVELQLMLEAVYRVAGYDFREYAPGTLKRRVAERVRAEGVNTFSGLQERLLHDPEALGRFVYAMSVTTSDGLFRDPNFFLTFRTNVIPMLRTFPFLRIWCANAGAGDDAYALAIILREEGLAHRSRIYSTDASEMAIDQAKAGRFPADLIEAYESRYRETGGTGDFSTYYESDGAWATFDPTLRGTILFAQHNLATDASFNEFHAILARNVLGHFSKSLSYRVHQILLESLVRLGYLGLGVNESLRYTPHQRCYEEVTENGKIYRRIR